MSAVRGQPGERDRGQSEVTGVVLLTAVVVVVVSVVGAVVLMEWQTMTESEPRANVHTDLTATTLTVKHMGGDTLAAAEVVVIVETSSGTERRPLTAFDGTREAFEPGSSWVLTLREENDPLAGVATVLLVHEPSGTILHREKRDIS